MLSTGNFLVLRGPFTEEVAGDFRGALKDAKLWITRIMDKAKPDPGWLLAPS